MGRMTDRVCTCCGFVFPYAQGQPATPALLVYISGIWELELIISLTQIDQVCDIDPVNTCSVPCSVQDTSWIGRINPSAR